MRNPYIISVILSFAFIACSEATSADEREATTPKSEKQPHPSQPIEQDDHSQEELISIANPWRVGESYISIACYTWMSVDEDYEAKPAARCALRKITVLKLDEHGAPSEVEVEWLRVATLESSTGIPSSMKDMQGAVCIYLRDAETQAWNGSVKRVPTHDAEGRALTSGSIRRLLSSLEGCHFPVPVLGMAESPLASGQSYTTDSESVFSVWRDLFVVIGATGGLVHQLEESFIDVQAKLVGSNEGFEDDTLTRYVKHGGDAAQAFRQVSDALETWTMKHSVELAIFDMALQSPFTLDAQVGRQTVQAKGTIDGVRQVFATTEPEASFAWTSKITLSISEGSDAGSVVTSSAIHLLIQGDADEVLTNLGLTGFSMVPEKKPEESE